MIFGLLPEVPSACKEEIGGLIIIQVKEHGHASLPAQHISFANFQLP